MNAGPRIESYEWRGGREPMLRWGPEDGPVVVLALPLFEEANRTRAFGVSILRAVAALGIGGVLPELPGQGESEIVTERAALADLREAFAAVPGRFTVAIRSGALVVDEARPCWLLSPQTGANLLRELARVNGGPLDGERFEVAGNLLSRELVATLNTHLLPGESRSPGSSRSEMGDADQGSPQLGPGVRRGSVEAARTVRLTNDRQAADLYVDASPLWRRAEPDNDLRLAQLLAADIAEWIRACEG